MKAQRTAKPLTADDLYPIRTIASMTGVNPVTLRAWERRYGLIRPQRTPKGHRLYTPRDVERIQRVLELLQQGVAVSRVGQILDQAEAIEPGPSTGGNGDAWQVYQQRMLAAIEQFDEATLDQLYNDALSLYPDDLVNTRISVPLLRELGKRWLDEADGIVEEHFFTLYLRNKLGSRIHHTNRRGDGPLLLVACLPGEFHELGMLFFAVTAVSHGFRVILLGANTPLEQLPQVTRKRRIDGIVLSATAQPERDVLGKQLSELVSRLSVPVFVGGTAAERQRDAIEAAGAVCAGAATQAALLLIRSALTGSR